MTESLTEDDALLQHTLNFDDLLRECDFSADSGLRMSGGFISPSSNIWANNGVSTSTNDFVSYGLTNGYHGSPPTSQWSTYGFGDGSPVHEDGFAQLSQPESDAGSENSWRFDGLDLNKASAEGAQRYAEALSKLNLSNGVYDPFKSGSVMDSFDGVHNIGSLPVTAVREKSPLRRSQSANSRPTFADVAKKPSSPGSEPPPTPSLSNDSQIYESQESLNSLLQDKKVKPKAFRPAHPRVGGYHVPLPINPDSKYGLDDFEVQEAGCKMERSFSCNDALDRSQDNTADSGDSDEESVDGDSLSSIRQKSPPSKTASGGGDWFDPKRIFQTSGSARNRSESEPCDTILNNNAAKAQATKANGRRTSPYINNLHDDKARSNKQTNADRAGKPTMNGTSSNGSASIHVVSPDESSTSPEDAPGETEDGSTSAAGDYVSGSLRVGKMLALELLKYFLLAVMFLAGFTGQAVYFVAHHTCVVVTTAYRYLAVKVGLNSGAPTDEDFNSFTKNAEQISYGLDENIKLPETSEEAMRRLLTCQGKDAYSILGIRSDASDEEIKRYYRRQAVLVHPDKNQQPGAEEAFKILGQAVELIGSPEKRKVYDRKIHEEKLSEDVMRQFSDLLTKFHDKMEEASNWMQCNNCGDKHRRYPTDKPVYSARKCNRCQCHHAAKEGDIWAETTFMGFKWHFYACMENKIYDVTPWISCQPDMVDKFQPNSHAVRLRMGLSSNGGNSSSRPGSNGSREAELENLLKNLFPQQHAAGTPNTNKTQQGTTDNSTKTNGTPCNRKGKRRARRR